MKNKNKILKMAVWVLVLFLTADIFVSSALPALVTKILENGRNILLGEEQTINNSIRIIIKSIGLLIFLLYMKCRGILKLYNCDADRECLIISWMFYIYIIALFDIRQGMDYSIENMLLMLLGAFMTGLYDEIVFRGCLLHMLLKRWGDNRKTLIHSVAASGILYGIFGMLHISSAGDISIVLVNAAVSAMIGMFFSAVLIRTDGKLMWCGILHGIFNMAESFGMTAKEPVVPEFGLVSHIFKIMTFIPLCLYAFFLLRKTEKVDLSRMA